MIRKFIVLRLLNSFLENGIDFPNNRIQVGTFMGDSNFTPIGKRLTYMGFANFLWETFIDEEDYMDIDPYAIFLKIIHKACGLDLMSDKEVKDYQKLEVENLQISFKKRFGIGFEETTWDDVLSNYKERNKEMNKSISVREKNTWRSIPLDILMEAKNYKQLTSDDLFENMKFLDITTPVIYKRKTLYSIDNDINDREALLYVSPNIRNTNWKHISTFVANLISTPFGFDNTSDIFESFCNGEISEEIFISLLILEIERRFYGCENIKEYLDGVISINVISNSDKFVCKLGSGHLFVIYRSGAEVIVEEKYWKEISMLKDVKENKSGVAVTGNKTLWDIVYKGAYIPINNHNLIIDSNRGK